MRRRAYLAGAAVALAGCTTGYQGGESDDTASGTPVSSPDGEANIVSTGLPATLCEEEISPGGLHPSSSLLSGGTGRASTPRTATAT